MQLEVVRQNTGAQAGTKMESNVEINKTSKHEFVIQDAKIVVRESGQGAPVIFLHGSPDTHDMWLPLMGYLNSQFLCIAPDLPGFGESTLPDAFALTLDNMADFVRDLVKALKLDGPVTLVTTDFGGHYGLAFTAKYPELVRGIAISNTNFFHDYDWHFFAKLYRMPVIGDLLMASMNRSVMRTSLKNYAPALPESYIDSSYDTGFGSPRVRKTILKMYRTRASKDFIGWEDRLLKALETTPAIVLWGDRDPFITPAFGDRWGKAKVRHFTEFSHWLPLEAPAQYADALLPWLKSL